MENTTRQTPTLEITGQLVKRGSFLLKAYHTECHKSAASRETEFWRGNLSGFRYAIGKMYGQATIRDILENIRKDTALEIPPIGEMNSEGEFLGSDSEADF
jgi:hypothetical protein